MPDSLVDIGNGIKMVNPESLLPKQTDTLQQAMSVLSLQNLQQQIQNAPLERIKLQQEVVIKDAQIRDAAVNSLRQRVDLQKAINDQVQGIQNNYINAFKTIEETFRVNPSVAQAQLKAISPNAEVYQNDDGSFTFELPKEEIKIVDGVPQKVPTKDKFSFSLQPDKMAPEEKAKLEGQWADRFQVAAKATGFPVINQYYDNLKGAADLATAQGDVAIIFSFMKMNDPTSVVREGEQATARNAPGVPDQLRNIWNRALTSKAPYFGEKGSTTRKAFIDAADVFYKNARTNMLNVGRNAADVAKRQRLDVQSIITPVGDITIDEFVLTDDELLDGLRKSLSGAPSGK